MRILRLIGGIVLLVVIFSSCVKEVSYFDEEIPTGNIVMKKQKPQRVSERMILEIIEIADTRCPIGSVCGTAGEVDIEFKAYIEKEFKTIVVCFDRLNGSCTTDFEGHKIQIVDVEPKPFVNKLVDPLDYRIKLSVTNN